tara:strand:+ start:48 stop:692 length:645 start_codon:yes stop_codon:yes gene_type:complete
MASVLQVATIKDQGGNANAIEIANSSANVTINNLATGTIGSGVSGIFNHINTTDLTGTSVEIDNVFSDTYDGYMIYFLKVQMAAETADLSAQFINNSGVVQTGSLYHVTMHRRGSGIDSTITNKNVTSMNIANDEIGNGAGEHLGGSIFLEGVRSTTTAPAYSGTIQYSTVANECNVSNLTGYYNDETGTFRGIKLSSNQTFSTGKVIIYGVRQ